MRCGRCPRGGGYTLLPRGWVIVRIRVFIQVVLLVEVVVVAKVLILVVQIRPDESSNIPSFFAFLEVYHAPHSVCAKDDAPENICSMLVTLDTSHLERSPLNDDVE